MKIIDLEGISPRLFHCLKRNGYANISEIVIFTEKEFRENTKNLGLILMEELRNLLHENKKSFKTELIMKLKKTDDEIKAAKGVLEMFPTATEIRNWNNKLIWQYRKGFLNL